MCRIIFSPSCEDAEQAVSTSYPAAKRSSQALIQDGIEQLTEYFVGQRQSFNLKLNNASLSQGELAALAGYTGAARAVGRVMSSNPFPLIVPCHRVINAGGTIGRYSAANGTRTKSLLIDLEHNHI